MLQLPYNGLQYFREIERMPRRPVFSQPQRMWSYPGFLHQQTGQCKPSGP